MADGGHEVRPIIAAFARAMEAKMCENDARGKGEWRTQAHHELLMALEDEIDELFDAIYAGDRPAALAEACDVALCALMSVDVIGALPETVDRGRVLVASVPEPIAFTPGTVRMASPLCPKQEVW